MPEALLEAIGSVTQEYNFRNPSDFTFVQKDCNQGPGRARTTGEIHIKPGGEMVDSKIWVEVETYVSDSRLSCCHGGTPGDNSLLFESVINCPTNGDYGDSEAELYIYATIYIAPDVTLGDLNVTTTSLSVHIHTDLDLRVSNSTSISAQAGNVVFMPSAIDTLYSRETIIEVTSGFVKGTYALYDLLSIHTTSGSIDINISLKNASASAVKPAALRLGTSSGSIRAHTPSLSARSSVPDRDYQSSIQSSSGSIDVSLVHGTRTSVRSSSGTLSASLYPCCANTTRSDIDTHVNSGRTQIVVHPSIVNSTDPLRRLYGSYNYLSGRFELSYPPSWEGTVEGVVASGSVDIDWDGLQVVEDRRGWVGRRIKAVKGDGEGVLKFQGASGSTRLSGNSW